VQTLDDLQRLTPSQGALLYHLVDLGFLTRAQVDELINRLVSDRFAKAMDYLAFAQQLDANVPLNQPHIISRCYYAMYHAARAVVFHHRRSDVDDHESLAVALGGILGSEWKIALDEWRKARNRLDYSPYLPDDLASQCRSCLDIAQGFLIEGKRYLTGREVVLHGVLLADRK